MTILVFGLMKGIFNCSNNKSNFGSSVFILMKVKFNINFVDFATCNKNLPNSLKVFSVNSQKDIVNSDNSYLLKLLIFNLCSKSILHLKNFISRTEHIELISLAKAFFQLILVNFNSKNLSKLASILHNLLFVCLINSFLLPPNENENQRD